MLLFVGLGNPGSRYADTPHNAGFAVCDLFAERHRFPRFATKFQGLFARGKVGAAEVGLLKPQTYMNLSGDSVAEALRYLPVELADVVVVYDEMDIPAGKLRLRRFGGSAGHNGMKSVIDRVGSEDFARIRVGVGRAEDRDAVGHLLGRTPAGERERFSATIALAADALDAVVSDGFEVAMNRFNGRAAVGSADAG
ncbi:MAG TPA: aminoacyl-tRNA hydrolase [Myxococcota bacterium]|nr:aminoacyl-tRNA hydrolase [Myxococcota bacterium]